MSSTPITQVPFLYGTAGDLREVMSLFAGMDYIANSAHDAMQSATALIWSPPDAASISWLRLHNPTPAT